SPISPIQIIINTCACYYPLNFLFSTPHCLGDVHTVDCLAAADRIPPILHFHSIKIELPSSSLLPVLRSTRLHRRSSVSASCRTARTPEDDASHPMTVRT
ncbi:hypothetical protein V2J09_023594, partial [Rumex salicifolius]